MFPPKKGLKYDNMQDCYPCLCVWVYVTANEPSAVVRLAWPELFTLSKLSLMLYSLYYIWYNFLVLDWASYSDIFGFEYYLYTFYSWSSYVFDSNAGWWEGTSWNTCSAYRNLPYWYEFIQTYTAYSVQSGRDS